MRDKSEAEGVYSSNAHTVLLELVVSLMKCLTLRMRTEEEYYLQMSVGREMNNELSFQLLYLKFMEFSVRNAQREAEYMDMSCRSLVQASNINLKFIHVKELIVTE